MISIITISVLNIKILYYNIVSRLKASIILVRLFQLRDGLRYFIVINPVECIKQSQDENGKAHLDEAIQTL
jgi:hypothetical protein